MPASLDSIQTSVQNLVQAVNQLSQTYLNVQGITTTSAISTATIVKASGGRACQLSITTAGSANGTIYDASTTSDTSRPIYTIPNTIGIVTLNLPTSYGIVVAPGTGQVVAVSWS